MKKAGVFNQGMIRGFCFLYTRKKLGARKTLKGLRKVATGREEVGFRLIEGSYYTLKGLKTLRTRKMVRVFGDWDGKK